MKPHPDPDPGPTPAPHPQPMGTLLVNERMLETYLYARDRFLKPSGKMFPQIGRIHAAAFTDPLLYGEVAQKAAFWQQAQFYGVDLTTLFGPAAEGYFSQAGGRAGGRAGGGWGRGARRGPGRASAAPGRGGSRTWEGRLVCWRHAKAAAAQPRPPHTPTNV
jgi:hypothetical protein